jgi:hypothetical protein
VVSEKQELLVGEGAISNRRQVPDAAGPVFKEFQLREMQIIARSEMARRRRQLGNLTPDQELAVEILLISAVSRISEVISTLQL